MGLIGLFLGILTVEKSLACLLGLSQDQELGQPILSLVAGIGLMVPDDAKFSAPRWTKM